MAPRCYKTAYKLKPSIDAGALADTYGTFHVIAAIYAHGSHLAQRPKYRIASRHSTGQGTGSGLTIGIPSARLP